ncbi:hypothetical protein WJX75_001148 [Coccomyxa subellipsoidea]|uniref:Metallo-dependent hydrolase n=1 Tax=Coccomyxa subellipsoidea TaxID=248742 RepID=A0ABR2YJV8_9CHLO
MILTGSSIHSSSKAAQIAEKSLYPIYFTAGVHPHEAKSCTDNTIEQLRSFARHPRCVAVGECGLDFNRNFSEPTVQETWFAEQVRQRHRSMISLLPQWHIASLEVNASCRCSLTWDSTLVSQAGCVMTDQRGAVQSWRAS